MRTKAILCQLLALGTLSLHTLAEPGTPRDQARAILALRSAAGEVMAEMQQRSSTLNWDTVQLTEQLTAQMLKDPSAHRRPQDSRNRSRTQAEQLQRAALEAALSNAVASAQARSPLPIRSAEVLELVGPSWNDQVNTTLERFMTNQFEAVYTGARLRAVALQQKTALEGIRFPEAGELDARLLARWQERKDPAAVLEGRDFDQLGGWLKSFATPKSSALLEEVERQIGDAASRRKDEIRQQYEHQVGVVRETADHVPKNRITRNGIADELLATLDQDLKKRQQAARDSGATAPLYPVFHIVRSNVWTTAEQLETERWATFLKESGEPTASEEELRKEIERATAQHRNRATSEALFTEKLTPVKQREAAATYAKQRSASDKARTELEGRLTETEPAGRAFQSRMKEALQAALEPARTQVAKAQIEELDFLPGADPLPDALMAQIIEREGHPAGNLTEALAFLQTGEKVDTTKLLEETDALAVEMVNKAIATGYEAIQAQAGLVREMEATRREQLARDVAADRPVDTLIKEWTTDFTKQWKRRAVEQNLRYDEPLAATRDLLNKTVRQLYDAQKQQKEAVAATPAPGAAAVSPSENQRDEPEDKEDTAEVEQHTLEEVLLVPCDASLIIRDVGDHQCEASMRIDPTAPPIIVRFAPNDAETAAQALFEGIRPGLAGLVEGKQANWKAGNRNFLGFKRKTTPELRFYMVVRSREIRHQTSLLLRSKISDLLQEWTEANHPDQPVTLDWTVGLGAVVGPE